jgi:phenylalanyl-tRNA synthetase beta chain
VVVSESVTHAEVMARVWAADIGGLLRNALLFDVYRPKPQKTDAQVSAGLIAGEKSLAVRLTLNSADASLTEAQIEAAVQAVVDQLVGQLGARLRA